MKSRNSRLANHPQSCVVTAVLQCRVLKPCSLDKIPASIFLCCCSLETVATVFEMFSDFHGGCCSQTLVFWVIMPYRIIGSDVTEDAVPLIFRVAEFPSRRRCSDSEDEEKLRLFLLILSQSHIGR